MRQKPSKLKMKKEPLKSRTQQQLYSQGRSTMKKPTPITGIQKPGQQISNEKKPAKNIMENGRVFPGKRPGFRTEEDP
ncbi:hypothetical protein V6N13_010516 [Hibiscus sabdariffa]|uniref:Uncharacterized protein n=1 Tax=Hibiscus sabdariffa TaxID=183260 RepID=A0ABR2NVT6_9ROSI